jgi:hypothetical protein
MNNANQMNDNLRLSRSMGSFPCHQFPLHHQRHPARELLLGVNDNDVAVGVYTDAAGDNHEYRARPPRGTRSRARP